MPERAEQEQPGGLELAAHGADLANGVIAEKGRAAALPAAAATLADGAPDAELAEKKLKYPKVVFFIIGNEFCERFTFYGMRTILSLFLKNALKMEESQATIVYHVFAVMCYFFPVLGAIIADSYLGKFKTIAYLSVVYAIGNIVVAFASATNIGLPSLQLTYLGLLLIAVGTGGIKPCVSSFGGEQFVVPQQERQLAAFFSVFYFSINAGSLISTYLTPELRTTKCLDQDTCYPIAFGVPAVLMLVAIVIFLVGRPAYRITNPKGNVLVDVSKCMASAVKNKIGRRGEPGREAGKSDWLDYADPKYGAKLRADIRVMLRVLLLFVPLPIFWALYDQQGSRWTFQANNMNGRIGSFVVKPDQMQVVNPVLIMILLPLFEYAVYPLLAKMHLIRKPLQKMVVGGMLGALAFIISGLVQQQLDPHLPVETSAGLAQVRVFSSLPCNVTLMAGGDASGQPGPSFDLPPFGFWERTDLVAHGQADLQLGLLGECAEGSLKLRVKEKTSVSYHLFLDDPTSRTPHFGGPYEDDLNKDAVPKTRLMYHFTDEGQHTVTLVSEGVEKYKTTTLQGTNAFKLPEDPNPAAYDVYVDGQLVDSLFFDVGGFYNILIDDVGEIKTGKAAAKVQVVIAANELSLFWQLPQYFVISVAEVMVSVTGLEFSFTQAPNSMKSVLSSAWLLTDAIGNVIIILIEAIRIFPNEADEIYLFAGLMAATMLVFIWLAMRYEPVTPPASDDDDDDATDSTVSTASAAGSLEKKTTVPDGESPAAALDHGTTLATLAASAGPGGDGKDA